MSRRLLLAGLLVLLIRVEPATADVHPNTAGGFPVDQSFHVGDIDSVNLFNGSLTLTVPIGPSFPVNGGFSYGLKLVYNSNPWIFQTVDRPDLGGSRTDAMPSSCLNAGLGWRVSLGRMDPPCQVPDSNGDAPRPIYQDEMGTDHIFYPTLHAGDPEDAPISGVQDVLYTRDGSYLRLKILNTGSRQVELPDGTVRTFNTAGMPTQIRDAFMNVLNITYTLGADGTIAQWNLSDTQNRTLTVLLHTDATSHMQLIDSIQMPAFGGTTATYSFQYSPASLFRPCPFSDSGPLGLSDSVSVSLLTGVSLPDGSAFTTTANDYLNLPQASGQHCSQGAGNITALTLPTLGSMGWTWQTFQFPTGSTSKVHLQQNPGVASRTMKTAAGAVLGTWTYAQASDFGSGEVKTTVTDPLGNRIINYFSTSVSLNFTGPTTYEYSLPFTRNTTLNVAPGVDLNLSRQTFQGSSQTPLRSEYVLYERDPVASVSPPDAYNTNRRLVRNRTLFVDDGGTFAGAVSSQFDGVGHYRSQDTEGNLPGSNVRNHFANANPAQGTYVVNAAANTGSGFTTVPSSSPWVLETMTYTSDTENGATARTDLCYAPATSTVIRKRVHRLDGGTQAANDLLSIFALDATGNVASEKYYGGDTPGFGVATGASDLCTMPLPANPQYQINHIYSFGVRATSQYLRASFLSLDLTLDLTGLVASSRDSAGISTSFLYDVLGRRTWSKPAQSGWTQFVYTPASPTIKPNVTVRQRDNGSESAAILAVSQVVFDDFGRVFQELRTLPDGSTSKRQTTYDGAGNKSTVSEVTTGTPNHVTTFSAYDPFGRPGTISPPDGAAHNVTMSYHGARQVDRTVKIATSAGSETPATTTEIYDRQGRLFSVTEPSGTGGANVTTIYGYDVGNRLASVSTTVNGTGVTQTRAFTYDRAGLLQSETHPEKGASGNGSVTYPSYDSSGHALQKVDGPHNLTFQYDSAERLFQIKESGQNGRVLKTFTYANANGANDLRQGKLQQASRYNYLTVGGSPFTVQIGETYTYGGRDGRVSQRDTQVTINGTASESFTQGFVYNALGLVSSLNYPLCTHAACTAPAVFTDVPAGSPFQREIEAIYPNVTAGCGPQIYCPANNITRGEMAVFLLRAKEGPAYVPPACTTPVFGDVPCSSNLAPWIDELARRGITGGCGGGNYCPNNFITNAEMAVFLTTSLGISPPACTTAPFTDVPCTAFAAAFIAEEARRRITTGCGGGNFCPTALVTRAQMAGLLVHAYDIPVKTDPATQRSVQFAYTQGLLTGVTGTTAANGTVTYGSLSYYPNLLVNQVAHRNGIVESQGNDPNDMRRPSSLAASGPYASWSSGPYAYDGAGNIKAIGTATFTYDPVSRLVSSTQFDGPTGSGTQKQQSYAFDAFGNLTNITGTSGRATPTAPQTNRLNGPGTVYDAAGNLTNWNGAVYTYDNFNQMIDMASGVEHDVYLYTADDERLWSFDLNRTLSHWTIRDLGGKILRDYINNNDAWSVGTDYIHRDGLLLAAETQTGPRHYHLDHLGTPRLITRAGGERVAYHVYYPFGEEATAFNQDTERMKFTGHERDLASTAGAGDDLDYMHARHESPVVGRFVSVDIGSNAKRAMPHPQAWNRYVYVEGNSLRYADLNGKELGLDVNMLVPPNETPAQSIAMGAAAGVVTGGMILAPAAGAASLEAAFAIGVKYQGVINFFRDLGAGLTGTPTIGQPISGDFERTLVTSKGDIGILADATTQGTTLTLKNAGIYGDTAKASPGVAAVMGALKQLGAELAAKGYTTLIVQGLRYSGAKPGHTQTIVLNLTNLAK